MKFELGRPNVSAKYMLDRKNSDLQPTSFNILEMVDNRDMHTVEGDVKLYVLGQRISDHLE